MFSSKEKKKEFERKFKKNPHETIDKLSKDTKIKNKRLLIAAVGLFLSGFGILSLGLLYYRHRSKKKDKEKLKKLGREATKIETIKAVEEALEAHEKNKEK